MFGRDAKKSFNELECSVDTILEESNPKLHKPPPLLEGDTGTIE